MDRHWAYCQSCNLQLVYRAMPLILGMFFDGTLHTVTAAPGVKFYQSSPRWPIYEHARFILD